MTHMYNRIALSLEKEGDPAIRDNVDGPGGHYGEINQPQKDKYSMIPFIGGIYIVKLTEAESRIMAARGCVAEERGMLVRGHRISVTQRNEPGTSDLESDGERGDDWLRHHTMYLKFAQRVNPASSFHKTTNGNCVR